MRYLIVSLSLLCLLKPPLKAQSGSENDVLTGRVTDLAGRPVADAHVGATALKSGVVRSYTTDGDGRFRLSFPGTAPEYILLVKRIGFSPVRRAIRRRTENPEEMTVDVQFGGSPLALSVVEIAAGSDAVEPTMPEPPSGLDATVPDPMSDILALKDTLHLSAVQIVRLTDLSDSLRARNTGIYNDVRALLAKSRKAGDITQMAGTVALMLEQAAGNTAHSVAQAEKLLRPEQWMILPADIRDRRGPGETAASNR